MSIATSIEKLSETLTNCKANLKEKEVADVDNIKISDVDEKIAEIQAGGGSGKLNNIKDLTINERSYTNSYYKEAFSPDGPMPSDANIKFTVTEDNCLAVKSSGLGFDPNPSTMLNALILEKGQTYTVTGDNLTEYYIAIFKYNDNFEASNVDFIYYVSTC